jgi:hypothetical protein
VNTAIKTLSLAALCWATNVTYAQEPSPPAAAADAPAASADAPADPAVAPKASAPAAKPAKSTAQSEAGEPRANTSRTAPAGRTAAGSSQKTPAGADRLELGTATVTGDREQPKVMYIVPWKRSDIGDLAGKPMNSLVDEILAPVDRDVFKREVLYYKAVQADASQNGARSHPSDQGEK